MQDDGSYRPSDDGHHSSTSLCQRMLLFRHVIRWKPGSIGGKRAEPDHRIGPCLEGSTITSPVGIPAVPCEARPSTVQAVSHRIAERLARSSGVRAPADRSPSLEAIKQCWRRSSPSRGGSRYFSSSTCWNWNGASGSPVWICSCRSYKPASGRDCSGNRRWSVLSGMSQRP